MFRYTIPQEPFEHGKVLARACRVLEDHTHRHGPQKMPRVRLLRARDLSRESRLLCFAHSYPPASDFPRWVLAACKTSRVTTAAAPIRPATASDIPALTALAADTFPLACPPTTTREAMDAHIAAKLNADVIGGWVSSPTHSVVVADAVVAGTLDGYALATFGPCGDPEAAMALDRLGVTSDPVHELSKIYVRAEAQGNGLATALMEAAIGATRAAHGDSPVWLGTNDANLRAQAFYRRHRFAQVGTRTFVVGGSRESDVVMLRRD